MAARHHCGGFYEKTAIWVNGKIKGLFNFLKSVEERAQKCGWENQKRWRRRTKPIDW